MATFKRRGHWRTSIYGDVHWVSEHYVSMDGGHVVSSRTAKHIHSTFTYSSFVNPNAKCPVCGQTVFFYRSPDGGCAYFDELGPPWPKHPCMDKYIPSGHIPNLIESYKLDLELESLRFAWSTNGWSPFILRHIDESGNPAQIGGYCPKWNVYLHLFYNRQRIDLDKRPLMIRRIDRGYELSTIIIEKSVVKILYWKAYNDIFEYMRNS